MDRSRGLSRRERADLLDEIDRLLGDSPKARLVREIVESLPLADEDAPQDDNPRVEVPEAD